MLESIIDALLSRLEHHKKRYERLDIMDRPHDDFDKIETQAKIDELKEVLILMNALPMGKE